MAFSTGNFSGGGLPPSIFGNPFVQDMMWRGDPRPILARFGVGPDYLDWLTPSSTPPYASRPMGGLVMDDSYTSMPVNRRPYGGASIQTGVGYTDPQAAYQIQGPAAPPMFATGATINASPSLLAWMQQMMGRNPFGG